MMYMGLDVSSALEVIGSKSCVRVSAVIERLCAGWPVSWLVTLNVKT